jgi:hypothetical protein
MSEPTPSWVTELSGEQWQHVRRLIDEALQRHGCTWTWDEPVGVIHASHPKRGKLQLGLGNLVTSLSRGSEVEWKRSVAHWARVMFAPPEAEPDLSDLAAVRPNLRIRLWNEEHLPDLEQIVSVPVMPGVVAILCVDLPEMAMSVPREKLEGWGVTPEEALSMAVEPTLAEPATADTLRLPEGPAIYAMESDGLYVTTRALVLQRWVESKYGALVAVPNRHVLLYHPITDGGAIAALYALHAMAEGAYKDGPGALVPSVYWWTPGRYMRIDVIESGDQIHLRVPEELGRALEEAAGPEV